MAAAAAAPETSRANISPAYEVAPGWVDHLQVSKSEAIVLVRSLNASLGWDDWAKKGLKGMIDEFMGPLLAALEGGSGENAPRRVMERLIVKVLKVKIGQHDLSKYQTRLQTWKEAEITSIQKLLPYAMHKKVINASLREDIHSPSPYAPQRYNVIR
jgi:hypothetical protein